MNNLYHPGQLLLYLTPCDCPSRAYYALDLLGLDLPLPFAQRHVFYSGDLKHSDIFPIIKYYIYVTQSDKRGLLTHFFVLQYTGKCNKISPPTKKFLLFYIHPHCISYGLMFHSPSNSFSFICYDHLNEHS